MDGVDSSFSFALPWEGIRELDVESFLTFDTEGQAGIRIMKELLFKTINLQTLKLTFFSDGNVEIRKAISELLFLEELLAREYSCTETD